MKSLIPAVLVPSPLTAVVAAPPISAPGRGNVRTVLRALFGPTAIPPGKLCDHCGEFLATIALYRPLMVCERCHWA